VPTFFGFAVVLVIVLFATQVVFDLYARSAVTSAAVGAARSVAGFASSQHYGATPTSGPDPSEQDAIAAAEARARAALGRYGDVTSFTWRFLPSTGVPQQVEVRVHFNLSGSSFDLARPLALPGLNAFDRTVRVRVERITCPVGGGCGIADSLAPRPSAPRP
jgi:hypothetical protein